MEFGKILYLLWQILDGLIIIWQTFKPTLANFAFYRENVVSGQLLKNNLAF